MRQLGIHFASLNIVSNYAEGNAEWVGSDPSAMAQFYRDCPLPVGTALVDAVRSAISGGIGECRCDDYQLAGMGGFPVDGA